jgi:hypothetical protein
MKTYSRLFALLDGVLERSARFLFLWLGLRPAEGVFIAVRVPSAEVTSFGLDLP